jgi:hypothetical protein
MARRPARRSSWGERPRRDRSEAGAVDRGHGDREEAGERARPDGPRPVPGEELPRLGRHRLPARGPRALLGDDLHPGVERRERVLEVVGIGVAGRKRADDPRHGPGRHALERRDGDEPVQVVAVDGVDVVAQHHAGIGDVEAGGAEGRGQAGGGARGVGARALLERERAGRRVLRAALEPGRDERVVVVARDEHDLLGPQRLAERREDGLRRGERVAHRPVAQLERIAQQHEPVRAGDRLLQRGERAGTPQGVRVRRCPEVQVADDEGAHPARRRA